MEVHGGVGAGVHTLNTTTCSVAPVSPMLPPCPAVLLATLPWLMRGCYILAFVSLWHYHILALFFVTLSHLPQMMQYKLHTFSISSHTIHTCNTSWQKTKLWIIQKGIFPFAREFCPSQALLTSIIHSCASKYNCSLQSEFIPPSLS